MARFATPATLTRPNRSQQYYARLVFMKKGYDGVEFREDGNIYHAGKIVECWDGIDKNGESTFENVYGRWQLVSVDGADYGAFHHRADAVKLARYLGIGLLLNDRWTGRTVSAK